MSATAMDVSAFAEQSISQVYREKRRPQINTLTEADGPPHWINQVIAEAIAFLELAENWDSHGARPINVGSVNNAIEVLSQPVFSALAAPAIVPTSIGGIQAEWHVGERSLEVEFISDIDIEVLFADRENMEEHELTLDLTIFRDLVRRLTA
jgi:hypothetical protein